MEAPTLARFSFARKRLRGVPHAPIKLTDAELDSIFAASRPLDPAMRDPFLQAVANALQQDCSGEIGPGTVARVCRDMQRQFFDPPDLERSVGLPRWSRRDGGIRRVSAET
jgi:hypothetical protein